MNINENLKNEVKCKKKKEKLKLPSIHFDQPFRQVILYENYLIHIVMNIIKTSKIAYWLSSKREGGGSILTWAPFCVLEQDTFTPKKVLITPRSPWLRPDMTEIKLK